MPFHRSVALVVFAAIVAAAMLAPDTKSTDPVDETVLIVDAADLMPLKPHTAMFVITEGEGKGRKSKTRLSKLDDGTWALRHGRLVKDILETDGRGAILLRSSQVQEQDSKLHFTPAATRLPARLETGKPTTVRSNVRVTDLSGEREKARGTHTRRIELVGKRHLKLPAGGADAYIVRTTDHFALGLADVDVIKDVGYVPHFGVVYRREERKITKIGLLEQTTVVTLELKDAPPP